jgi:ATP-dependent Clp protease ATP-binding subunit ClpC
MNHDWEISKKLAGLGVTVKQIEHEISNEENGATEQTPAKSATQQPTQMNAKQRKAQKRYEKKLLDTGDLEKYIINVNKLAADGKVDEVIGNEEIIKSVFTTLMKRDRNNALLVGDVGSGKTSTVMHIANLLNDGSVPKQFENRQLMLVDFMSLVSGTGYRGGFEQKYETIIESAKKHGNCIFFIDDVQSILGQNSKFSEVSTDTLLDKVLSEKRIPCICTTTYEGYSKTILGNEILNSRFEKIDMPKRDKNEIIGIVERVKEKYELFHEVTITKEFVKKTVDACERFMNDYGINTVCEVIDTAASIERISEKPDEILTRLKEELSELEEKISAANSSTNSEEYEAYDNLMKEKVAKKSEISQREKTVNLTRKKTKLGEKRLMEVISKKTGLPVGELTKDETVKLSKLNEKLKEFVIGQDEAVETVCKAVRRQRSGLTDKNKPQVFMFVGRTGCGKTYLAKKLSETVYGSERNMIRLDMSEYSDKISVNKLTGASSGYIGYDDGGVLTEAVKKNKHCVVLLDEIEKADDGVFDVFLQVFDEGRLTDNKGVMVDFSDTIIIMTSNIGMKEIEDRGVTVGFTKNNSGDYDREVVLKTLKKRFKPEFLNRINNIVFFNSLTDEDIRRIIINELKKTGKRVENAGYSMAEDVYNGKTVENIFNEVRDEKEYGARPVIRTIERLVEDRIADLIIEGHAKKGHAFTDEEISSE